METDYMRTIRRTIRSKSGNWNFNDRIISSVLERSDYNVVRARDGDAVGATKQSRFLADASGIYSGARRTGVSSSRVTR